MNQFNLDQWGRRRVSAALPPELVVRVDKFGHRHGYFSRSELVAEAIREFLERHGEKIVGPSQEHLQNRITRPPSDLRPPYYGIRREDP